MGNSNSGRKKLPEKEKKVKIVIYKKQSDIELLGRKDVTEYLSGQFDVAIMNRRLCAANLI